MPYYNDNLYSLNRGDPDDDYAHQLLSPSDGYFASSSTSSSEEPFNAIPDVPNVLIPDPTLQQQQQQRQQQTASESKAQEAGEERHLVTNRSHSGRAQQQQHRRLPVTYSLSSAASSRRTPSIYSEAPPAYTPSPLAPAGTRHPTQPRSYNTFFTGNMGVAEMQEQNERLLGSSQPESMSQPLHDEEAGGAPEHWRRRVRRRLPPWMTWRVVLLTCVVLIAAVGFLSSSYRIVKGDGRKTIAPSQPVEELPPVSKEPAEGDDDPLENPAAPFKPTYCKGAQHRFDDQILSLDFTREKNLTFVEDSHAHDGGASVNIGGQVNIRQLDFGGEPRMVLELVTNHPNLLLDVLVDEDDQLMKVSVPKKYSIDQEEDVQDPCVEVRATVWVPPEHSIGTLSVGVLNLDILLMDDLALHVADYTTLSSATGDISSAASEPLSYDSGSDLVSVSETPGAGYVPAKSSYNLNSRVVEVSTTTGHVDGNWPLHDMLGLHTTSGNIDVSITPRTSSSDTPAVLSLSTISGALTAHEPIASLGDMPLRDYLLDLKSTSGAIRGALATGSGATVKSTASDVELALLPILDEARVTSSAGTSSSSPAAQLETVTTSGQTTVRVAAPLWFSSAAADAAGGGETKAEAIATGLGDSELLQQESAHSERPLDCLAAVHKSTSGDVRLHYPAAWTGALHASTTSGRMAVRGRDVRVLTQTGGLPGSGGGKLEARKGPADQPGSVILVKALMGNLEARIGPEK
ncbi:hypothetical protein F4780DRAFT_64301 [Xylariomycetidae sp. FL0641]|nr:hypothetical protein F4780DRAFT_64301 [Xylariomycetidae sp. FL0641]